MHFLPKRQLNELIKLAAIADKEARSDLSLGYIVNENDYTSNFTGALRRIINSNSITGLTATSYLLTSSQEREFGADAAIILNHGNYQKVAIFEGKWPRFSVSGHKWDQLQKSTNKSHFSDQLLRQSRWSNQFAVFERIYCEFPFGKQPYYLENEGSSCIWFDDAEGFRLKNKVSGAIWTQNDLVSLLKGGGIPITSVVRDFGNCRRGDVLEIMDPEILQKEFRLPANILSITSSTNEIRR